MYIYVHIDNIFVYVPNHQYWTSMTNRNCHLYNYRYVNIYLPETWFKLVQRATKIEYENSLRHIFDPESHRSLTALNYWKKKMMQWGEKSNFAEQSWFLCVKYVFCLD